MSDDAPAPSFLSAPLRILHKYWVICRQTFADSFTHRAEMGLWVVLDSIPTIVILCMWTSVFAGQTEIRGYTLQSAIQYSFLLLLLGHLLNAHFEATHASNIRLGKVDLYFTRPLSFISYVFWLHLAKKIFYLCLILPFSLVIAIGLFLTLGMTLPVPTMTQTLQLLPLLAFGFLVEFAMSLVSVLLVFWFEGANSLEHFKWATMWILSGALIPRPFMPKILLPLVDALPFKYVYGVPIEVYQGRTQLVAFDLLYMAASLLALTFVCSQLWLHARKRYSSAGG